MSMSTAISERELPHELTPEQAVEAAYAEARNDPGFQDELDYYLEHAPPMGTETREEKQRTY